MKVEHLETFFFFEAVLCESAFQLLQAFSSIPASVLDQSAHLWIRVGVGQTERECSGTFPSQVKGGREWVKEEYNIDIKNIYIWIIMTCTQNRAAGCLVGTEQAFCQLCPFLAADCILFLFLCQKSEI